MASECEIWKFFVNVQLQLLDFHICWEWPKIYHRPLNLSIKYLPTLFICLTLQLARLPASVFPLNWSQVLMDGKELEDRQYVHQQKPNLLHYIYLAYCIQKLKKIKLRFPWNMALLYCCRVFFESSRCCLQASQPVYPLLRMWHQALDEWFTLPLAISHIISQHTPRLPNSISPHDDDSTHSIRLMKHVVLVFKDTYDLIWPMIVTIQKWFTIFNLLIQDRQSLPVQLSWEGYASSRLWLHAFEIRLH